MVRGLLNIFAVVCILLCLALLWLWVRSYSTYDTISYAWSNGNLYTSSVGLASAEGTFEFRTQRNALVGRLLNSRFWVSAPPGWCRYAIAARNVSVEPARTVIWNNLAGEFWDVRRGFHLNHGGSDLHIEAPHWFLALFFGVLGGVAGTRRWISRQVMTMSNSGRRHLRKSRRMFLIGATTVVLVVLIVTPLFGFSASDAWAAVWETPLIYLLFIALPIGGLLSAIAILNLQKRRIAAWHKRHLCPTCGYNLTGNASGKCPECGTTVRKADVPKVQTTPA